MSGSRRVGCVNLARRRDFTERDRLILNLLRPHVELAHRNARRLTTLKNVRGQPRAVRELTPRQTEVAHWLALGKTNPEIAIILASSVRTVENHVEAILAKLVVENRTAAAVLINNSAKAKCDSRLQPATA